MAAPLNETLHCAVLRDELSPPKKVMGRTRLNYANFLALRKGWISEVIPEDPTLQNLP